MNQQQKQYILAVDVSKESLQIQCVDRSFEVPNQKSGFTKIIKDAQKFESPFVILESSGGYEKALMSALYDAKISVARISADRVRAFAKSEGIRAKNDSLDAKVLLRFAQEKHPKPTPAPTPEESEMAEALDRRTQLSNMLTQEKNRLEMASKSSKASINRVIKTFESEMRKTEKRIREIVEAHPALKTKFKEVTEVSGVGEITGWAIVAYVPEITRLNRNQLVALVGLAPFDKDSGKMRGPRRIEAGRAKVRRALYMAALVASKHNPVIRAYVERLKAAGKPHKAAMTAAMRKLLIHIQSRLKTLEKSESV